MAIKVWGYGVLVIFAFIAGILTESGDRTPVALIAASFALPAWSLGVCLVAAGYEEGKKNSER